MADNGVPDGYFDAFKYGGTPNGVGGTYIDGSDALANSGDMVVSFMHVPSQTKVFFKAFIIGFNESYASDWTSEVVFGRTDPIQHFKQTSRRISLGLKVPAATHSEAFENLGRVQHLIQFLYPNYENVGEGGAQTLAQNPLIRMKVMNLARTVADTTSGGSSQQPAAQQAKALYTAYTSTADADKGLLGVITSLSVAHNLDNPGIGVLAKEEGDANVILPKMIELQLDFTVIHEKTLGWKGTKFNAAQSSFPYGVDISGMSAASVALEKERIANASRLGTKTNQQDIDRAKARYMKGIWRGSRLKGDMKEIGQLSAQLDPTSKKYIKGNDPYSQNRREAIAADLAYFQSAVRGTKSLYEQGGGNLKGQSTSKQQESLIDFINK
jgi:hypothetical protein